MQCLKTGSDWYNLILRLAVAVAIFPHGAQKVLGWFGGYGFSASMQYFAGMGIPYFLGLLVMAAEFLGSLGLFFGFLTRLAALGILCDMIGAVSLIHWHNGFFMNWTGKQPGEGFEYHILVIGICLTLIIAGAGKWSVDYWISRGAREGE